MKPKTNFLLHHDTLSVIDELTDEQSGQLLKEMYRLSVSLNNPDNPVGSSGLCGLMNLVFHPFKAQLLRDFDKYAKICERNRSNGDGGGRPTKPTGGQSNPNNPDKPDSDSDSDSDTIVIRNDSDNDTPGIPKNILTGLQEMFGTLDQRQMPQLMELNQKIPNTDVDLFMETARNIWDEAGDNYKPGVLTLAQKTFKSYKQQSEEIPEEMKW